MLPVLDYPSSAAEERLLRIERRRPGADPELESKVSEILSAVRREGDAALVRFTRQFDAPEFRQEQLQVSEREVQAAYDRVDLSFFDTLERARAHIEAFHRCQLRSSWFMTRDDGTFLGQIFRPVASAGLYIPGGKGGETPLISTVLMTAVPARVAGVSDIAMVTPPRRDGSVNPYLLVTAKEVGVRRIHRIGSAWAVGALAFGTPSVSPVDVIVGPGNIYVTLAKKLVSGEVGIDLLAGPSEILVLADETASPEHVAADLLSQAEHDPLASAVLVTTDPSLARAAAAALERRLGELARRDVTREALNRYGAIFLVRNLEQAVGLANRLAPEHLEIQVRDPWACLGKIHNAGAVFIGPHTPEPVGDYFAGPNHVLPTAGTARFASALSVDHFVKKTSIVAYSQEAFARDAEAVMQLARLEGLDAHAASIRARMEADHR